MLGRVPEAWLARAAFVWLILSILEALERPRAGPWGTVLLAAGILAAAVHYSLRRRRASEAQPGPPPAPDAFDR